MHDYEWYDAASAALLTIKILNPGFYGAPQQGSLNVTILHGWSHGHHCVVQFYMYTGAPCYAFHIGAV